MKISGVTIRVKDLDAAARRHAEVLGVEPVPMGGDDFAFPDQVRGVRFHVGDTYVMLITGVGPDSPVTKALEKNGEGFSQLAFEVEDVDDVFTRLSDAGIRFTSDAPQANAAGRVAWAHPKSMNGVMWEFEEFSDGE